MSNLKKFYFIIIQHLKIHTTLNFYSFIVIPYFLIAILIFQFIFFTFFLYLYYYDLEK